MRIQLKYFGQAAEVSGLSEELIENLDEGIKLAELLKFLVSKYPDLDKLNLNFAVNQKIKAMEFSLASDCEVAVLPPFAGG